jgi:hypothetical protein
MKAIETDREFGPMMNQLDVQEQIFVCNLFMGITSITKAAELAGYRAINRAALRVQAHRLLRKRKVAEAVKEEAKRRTVFLLPKAQKALDRILDNPQHADHFKAIKMARDDGGVSAAVERVLNVNMKVEVTQAEKVQQIQIMAKAMGIDPAKLLGYTPEQEITDAEFEDVDAELEALR